MRPDLIDVALSVYGDMLTATMPDKSDRSISLAEAQASVQRQPSARAMASRGRLAAAFLGLPAGSGSERPEDVSRVRYSALRERERASRDRHVDPRDVFVEEFELPRGQERHSVTLSGSPTRKLLMGRSAGCI